MCFTFQSNLNIARSQGLEAFAFCVVTVNNIPNLGSKRSVGVIYKDDLCTELRLKLWFESDWYFFLILPSLNGFKSNCREKKIPNNYFLKSAQHMRS